MNEIFFECLVGDEYGETKEVAEQYDLFTVYSIITSFARLCPDKTNYLYAFIPQLHGIFESVFKTPNKHFKENDQMMTMLVPDITMYMNMWLSLATFATMQPNYKDQTSMPQPFKLLINDLIKLFNDNPRWHMTDIEIFEAINISVGIAVMKLKNEKFIGDVGDIIRVQI